MIILCSCNQQPEEEGQILVPPSPPDPFPVEWHAGIHHLNHVGTSGEVVLGITVWTTVEYDSPVTVKYTLYKIEYDRQDEVDHKEILNKHLQLNMKEEIDSAILIEDHGRYRILVKAEYNGYGQQSQFFVNFVGDKLFLD